MLTELTKTDAPPATSAEALRRLNEGNTRFAEWVDRESQQSGFEARTGLVDPRTVAVQQPFGVVVGCSDARFPLLAALGQKANSLFAIQVAGNVLGDECLGSIDYALTHLPSVKTLVVLGHTHCGAVTAAVGGFLKPASINAGGLTIGLRAIVRRLLGPVALSSEALRRIMQDQGRQAVCLREQLIETAIYTHAASAALDLQTQVQQAGRTDVGVVHGVFDLQTYRVRSPRLASDKANVLTGGLSPAPHDTDALEQLASATAAAVLHRAPGGAAAEL